MYIYKYIKCINTYIHIFNIHVYIYIYIYMHIYFWKTGGINLLQLTLRPQDNYLRLTL